jgi:hypothetical protein
MVTARGVKTFVPPRAGAATMSEPHSNGTAAPDMTLA